jgi:hypothetical protein
LPKGAPVSGLTQYDNEPASDIETVVVDGLESA